MKRNERVRMAIMHRETDSIPYTIELVSELQDRVEARLGLPKGGFSDWAGNHVLKADPDRGGYLAPGRYRDEYGVVWNRTIDKDIGCIEEPLLKTSSLKGYELPHIDLELVRQRMEALMGNGKDAFKVFKIGSVLFERAWFLRGFEDMMNDFYSEPGFVHELMEALTARIVPAIETALECGAEGLYLGDDYGGQTGMLMSPEMWRRFIRPYLQRLMNPALNRNRPVFLHSCGNIAKVLPDLIDMGLSVYQTVQPEIYDLAALKREFGRYLCFFGAIGTQSTLPHDTTEGVRNAVRSACSILGRNGGYICGPTHKVTADTPVDNILAMAATLMHQNE